MTEFVEKVQIVGADGTPLTVNADGSIDISGGGGGGGGAPTDATYITQTPSAGLSAEQAMSALATGIVKNTNGTGVLSIAAADTDYVTPSAAVLQSLADAKGDLIAATAADTFARVAVGANGTALIAASGATPGVNWAYPPGYEFGYDQITSDVTITATSEASGTTIISCAAHTFDGGPVVLQFFYAFDFTPTGGGSTVDIGLFEGSTQITRLTEHFAPANRIIGPFSGWFRFTPTAASHTYTITGAKTFGGAGTAIVKAGAGGTAAFPPSYARFIKA